VVIRRRGRHFVLSGLAFLLLGAAIAAQPDPVDDFIHAQMQQQNIPGLSLAVLQDGEIIKIAGYGLADIEGRVPATPETVYKIASVSKQFIATGIMLLVQEGRLGLDDAVSRYLQGTPDTWSAITIRHLLTHTSGLIREGPDFDPSRIQSDADIIESAYSRPLLFTPGEKWEYSNLGYFALAEIIRVASGQPWSEYLEEKVFVPAGMSATRTTTTSERVPNLATSYNDNDRLLPAADWPALRPSGAFYSTVLDLAKWDAVLRSDAILSRETRRQMGTPVKLNDGSTYPYGFGWQLGDVGGHRLVHHSGGMTGFRASLARFVDDGLTVIVLMNLDDVDVDTIVHGVARLYLPADASRES